MPRACASAERVNRMVSQEVKPETEVFHSIGCAWMSHLSSTDSHDHNFPNRKLS